jgi:hypothetical protein
MPPKKKEVKLITHEAKHHHWWIVYKCGNYIKYFEVHYAGTANRGALIHASGEAR